MVKIKDIILVDKNLLDTYKKIVIDNLTKFLLVIKHKYFMGIIRIENKKKLLIFIKQKDNFRDIFQQYRTNFNKLFEFEIDMS